MADAAAPPVTRAPPGPKLYARLELLSEVSGANGAHGTDLVVLRPTARVMARCLDGTDTEDILERFVTSCCRITNGTGTYSSFPATQLNFADGREVLDIVQSISADVMGVRVDGDGINEPIVYNLLHPIALNPQDPEADVIRQIEFKAKRIGEISNFLDAVGVEARFDAFMRGFGQMLGTQLPMSDSIIGAMDVHDFVVIMQHIAPLLSGARGRWRRE